MRRKIESRLLAWKDRVAGRTPLLIYGARHTGKTHVLKALGEKYYRNMIYINLETELAAARYFEGGIKPDRLIRLLEAATNDVITPGETLIVFDEIQSCGRAMTSLKHFCDSAPEYHVAAAGSLLDVAVNRGKCPPPHAGIELAPIYPLDFEEFLWALEEEPLAERIRACHAELSPMPEALHRKAVDLYRRYLYIGGMPACVAALAGGAGTLSVPAIQREIVSSYTADMAKYSRHAEIAKIRACYGSIPAQLTKESRKFQYKTVQKGGSASLYGAAIDWLLQSGVALKCRKLTQATEPLRNYGDPASFKLYFNDTGLLTVQFGLTQQAVMGGDSGIYMQAVSENYAAQTFVTNGYQLFYGPGEHSSEIDFVLQKGADIIGVEVKRGARARTRSLSAFTQRYSPAYTIRLSEKNFGEENGVRAIPLYAAFCT
ncbi:MAG: ATP-binding protein [Oscillospiraceae bacterium]|jgi:predicted AAA+ superfamily ATPase|nr:ATP-binding protein [Oscillospiraceae bacterium]